MKKVTVKLTEKDWSDLIHFITGDLHNMEDSEVKDQMKRIQDEIRLAIAKALMQRKGRENQ